MPTPTAGSQRTYGEKQVAEILRGAASLGQKKKLERPELSLEEIETIARDAGIDPAMVRLAARDLDLKAESQGLGSRLAGAPLTFTVERVVEGELTAAQHELLAADIREALPPTGLPIQFSTLGRSFSASVLTRSGLVDVQATPRDGKTSLRLTVNSRPLAGGLFGGLIGGIGGGLGGNALWMVTLLAQRFLASDAASVAVGMASLLGIVGGAYGLARTIFSRMVGSTHRRIERLADTLEGHLREALR